MKKIVLILVVFSCFGCSFIPASTELIKKLHHYRIIAYYQKENKKWHFHVFVNCDKAALSQRSISCKQERLKFQIFKRERALI